MSIEGYKDRTISKGVPSFMCLFSDEQVISSFPISYIFLMLMSSCVFHRVYWPRQGGESREPPESQTWRKGNILCARLYEKIFPAQITCNSLNYKHNIDIMCTVYSATFLYLTSVQFRASQSSCSSSLSLQSPIWCF